jgi:hypothetical protein
MALRTATRPLPTQLFLSRRPPNRDIRPVSNQRAGTTKPAGGLWTADYRRATGSAWAEQAPDFYDDARFAAKFGDGSHGWLLRPDPAARVYVLDSLRDAKQLQERFPRFPEEEFRHGLYTPISHDWQPQLDWVAISQAYDAVRLSARGWRPLVGEVRMDRTRWRYGPMDDWIIPSTLWFRWSFVGESELASWPRL